MTNAFVPSRRAYARVFLIDGRARPDHAPDFQSCLMAGAVSWDLGDITKIECPSPNEYGQFEEVGEIQGAIGRVTTTLTGRHAADLASTLLGIARKRCDVDVQVHFGACTDPSDFNTFTKALVFEKARFINYGTEDLVALSSDENASVNESVDISAKDYYEILPLTAAERGESIITNELVDGIICGTPSCGDCDTENDGCYKSYWITLAAGGSASTPADIVFTVDKGATWYADDIDSLLAAENPSGIACLGTYLVVVSNDSGSLHYALKSEVDDVDFDETWTEVATGFVAGHEPNDIWSVGTYAFIVGDGGYVYGTADPTAGVTVLDAAASTVDNLLAVHAISETFAVAVGNNGQVIYTDTGDTWTDAPSVPVGVGINLNCVWVKSEEEWWVGTSTGRLYYTLDAGVNWTEKTFTGSGAGVVRDIAFANNTVGYFSHDTATPRARIFRTFDGGYSWTLIPEGAANLPLADRFTAIAACAFDVNYVVAGGLADDGSDGILVVAED